MTALACAGWLLSLAALAATITMQRRRAELVARACHELAGPLSAAGLALHAARREVGAAPRLAAVDLELRRAALALEDLDAARTGGRARDHAMLVDVGCLLAQQALAWQVVARERGRGLRVAAGSGLLVHGDPVRLAQAVGNLLANALEHGAGTVVLRATTVAEYVRIEVCDDGPGLSAPLAALARRRRGGRGARGRGLAIVAEIAARHGGRLAAAPSAGGARLALDLPARRRAA